MQRFLAVRALDFFASFFLPDPQITLVKVSYLPDHIEVKILLTRHDNLLDLPAFIGEMNPIMRSHYFLLFLALISC